MDECFLEKKSFYKDTNQTENFTWAKTEMTYITGVKNTINPKILDNDSGLHFVSNLFE